MSTQVEILTARLLTLPAVSNFDHSRQKLTLGAEFLRRLKLWERTAGLWPGYPFGDLGLHVAPQARAREEDLAQVRDYLATHRSSSHKEKVCLSALHLAAAEDAGALAGFNLPRLYMPMIGIYALGGSGHFHKGYFEVDLGSLRLGERDWADLPALTVEGDDEWQPA